MFNSHLFFSLPFIKKSQVRFLDTMSLHIALCGMTSFQQVLYQSSKKSTNRKDVREYMEMKSSRKQMVISFKYFLQFCRMNYHANLNIVMRDVFALLSTHYNKIQNNHISENLHVLFDVIYIEKKPSQQGFSRSWCRILFNN